MIIFIIIGILVLTGVVFGASKLLHFDIPYLSSGSKTVTITQPVASESPTIMPTPTLVATPSPTLAPIDRSKISIEVLNGGGVPGAAKKMSDFLTNLGYTVSSTGNADSFDYATTTVEVKSTEQSLLSLLKDDLAGSYTVGTADASLSSGTTYDARVIVGKQ